MEGSDAKRKPRHRVPTLCATCRRRRMKCDRARPRCGACVESRLDEACVYNTQPWELSLQEENRELKSQIADLRHRLKLLESTQPPAKRPRLDESTDLTPPSGHTSSAQGLLDAPASPATSGSAPVTPWLYSALMLDGQVYVHFGAPATVLLMNADVWPTELFDKAASKIASMVPQPFCGLRADTRPTALYGYALMANLQFSRYASGDFHPDLRQNAGRMAAQVSRHLPPANEIARLTARFFELAYVFAPFIDREQFALQVAQVTHVENNRMEVRLRQHDDLVVVAMLLLVLRFAAITEPHASGSRGNVVPLSLAEYARLCLSHTTNTKVPALVLIQCLLLLRVYRKYSPQDGDEGLDCTLLVTVVVQMCQIAGFHRDPARFASVLPQEAHLRRKIWVMVCHLDVLQAIHFGCPLLVRLDAFDTTPPVADVSFSEQEKKVCHLLGVMLRALEVMRGSIELCNQQGTITTGQLQERVAAMDSVLSSIAPFLEFTDFRDLVRDPILHRDEQRLGFLGAETSIRALLMGCAFMVNMMVYQNTPELDPEARARVEASNTLRAFEMIYACNRFLLGASVAPCNSIDTMCATAYFTMYSIPVYQFFTLTMHSHLDIEQLAPRMMGVLENHPDALQWVLSFFISGDPPLECVRRLVQVQFDMLRQLSMRYYRCYLIMLVVKLALLVTEWVEQDNPHPPGQAAWKEEGLDTLEQDRFWKEFFVDGILDEDPELGSMPWLH